MADATLTTKGQVTIPKPVRDHLKLETARTWRVVNPNVLNAVGEPVGYKFLPMDNSFPMASPEAWWRKRAGFVNYHLWVPPSTTQKNTLRVIIPIKAQAAMDSSVGPNRIARSRTRTSSSGTPSGIPTSLVPRTIR